MLMSFYLEYKTSHDSLKSLSCFTCWGFYLKMIQLKSFFEIKQALIFLLLLLLFKLITILEFDYFQLPSFQVIKFDLIQLESMISLKRLIKKELVFEYVIIIQLIVLTTHFIKLEYHQLFILLILNFDVLYFIIYVLNVFLTIPFNF